MTKKVTAMLIMALALFAVVACTPQTADTPVEEVEVSEEVQQTAVEEAATAVPVAEEPATPTSIPVATQVPEPTDAPEEIAETEPEAEAEADEAVEEVDDDGPDDAAMAESAPVQFGRTEDGAFYYGSPTAEIVLIDHSDFL